MTGLFVALVAIAAFLLGLRAGIAIGYRAERRRKGDLPRARA
jgi:hypothetical protein